jgi:hypothetical protein
VEIYDGMSDSLWEVGFLGELFWCYTASFWMVPPGASIRMATGNI